MANNTEFWNFSDQLRLETTTTTTSSLANLSIGGGDSIWNDAFLSQRRRNLDLNLSPTPQTQTQKQKQTPPELNGSGGFGWKGGNGKGVGVIGGLRKNQNQNFNDDFGGKGGGFAKKKTHHNNNNNNNNSNDKNGVDKRFKTLPATEALPRNEAVGGYIFVCNNDTMPENLQRELFGLPPRYRDSVRAITPGLPSFSTITPLTNSMDSSSFGGSNIDPTAWQDKKCPRESRFPAQVRAKTKKVYAPMEEDSFRPILHHYDGPKFRLELSVPETLALLDKFEENCA